MDNCGFEMENKVYSNRPAESDETSKHDQTAKIACKEDTDNTQQDWKLLYKLGDIPPVHLIIPFALQQVLMSLSGNVIISVLVARSVCGEKDDELKAQLLSTTMLMAALTTLLQVTFGIRLSIYQGPTPAYLIPILALSSLPEWKCPAFNLTNSMTNATDMNKSTLLMYREINILPRLQLFQGSLILASVIHTLLGLTGLIGIIMRYLGPITVIPTLLLLGLEFYTVVTQLCESHWGVSALTAVVGFICAVYLEGWQMPIPLWTRSKGFHIFRYPLQQVLAILLSMGIGWTVCGILTTTGVLTSDPNKKEYKTRTDYGTNVITNSPWFYMPYPGQFGPIDFNAGVFIGFMSAVLITIIDSIGDYYACAKMCHVPPPPLHALNRGIMLEGLMSIVSGFYGTGHGTTTISANIGCIGITKVASRIVYQVFAVVLILLSVCGKFGAVFVTIPDPVLGGSVVVGFGIFLGLILSNLQYIDLNSNRNLAVIGVSILVGLMIPSWAKNNSELMKTGLDDLDRLIKVILTNATLFGSGLAFFLDNTVKGTKKERGLEAWDTEAMMKSDTTSKDEWEEDASVYEIVSISKRIRSIAITKYIPIMPNFDPDLFSCKSKCK